MASWIDTLKAKVITYFIVSDTFSWLRNRVLANFIYNTYLLIFKRGENMNFDPAWLSALIGRYGVIIWSIVALILQKTGYSFGAEDQASANAIAVDISV